VARRFERLNVSSQAARRVDGQLVPLGQEDASREVQRISPEDWRILINVVPLEELVTLFMPTLVWFNPRMPQHHRFYTDSDGRLKTVDTQGQACDPPANTVCKVVMAQLWQAIKLFSATVHFDAARRRTLVLIGRALEQEQDAPNGVDTVFHREWASAIMHTIAVNAKTFAAPRTIRPFGQGRLAAMETLNMVKGFVTTDSM
jgi:hypothetical protein